MISRNFWCLSILAISACTFEPYGSEQKIEFHPPLSYSSWQIQPFTTKEGQASCTVTSGYSGLDVNIRSTNNNDTAIAIRPNRKMVPGERFSINVGGNHYRTSGIFVGSTAEKLADDLLRSDKAYLEWKEPAAGRYNRTRKTNILKLDDFEAKFNKCKQLLL